MAEEPGDSPIGLVLIGASWCPFCKAAAQTLFAAAPPAHLPVLVASHDGKPIPPFEEFVDARGHPVAAKYLKLPTLVFVHTPTQKVIAEIEGFKNPRSYLMQVKAVLQEAREAGYA
jgi:glutaredoxin